MSWKEIYSRIDSIVEYATLYAELKSSGSFEGTRHYNLPTFEYYYQNCVVDKGGKYDFTRLAYGNSISKVVEFPTSVHGKDIQGNLITGIPDSKIVVRHKWNYWMGTEFGRIKQINIS